METHGHAQSFVKGFVEKPVIRDVWINAGVYNFGRQIIDYLPDRGDLETEVLPRLASESNLEVVRYHDAFWRTINSFKDIEESSKEIALQVVPPQIQISK